MSESKGGRKVPGPHPHPRTGAIGIKVPWCLTVVCSGDDKIKDIHQRQIGTVGFTWAGVQRTPVLHTDDVAEEKVSQPCQCKTPL